MNCPACRAEMKTNEIQCRHCDNYLPKEAIKFQILKPRQPILRLLINAIGWLILLSGLVTLISLINSIFYGFYFVVIPVVIGIFILSLNKTTSYYDCPNCHAEKSVLVKEKMIKSHCKYCREQFEFTE